MPSWALEARNSAPGGHPHLGVGVGTTRPQLDGPAVLSYDGQLALVGERVEVVERAVPIGFARYGCQPKAIGTGRSPVGIAVVTIVSARSRATMVSSMRWGNENAAASTSIEACRWASLSSSDR